MFAKFMLLRIYGTVFRLRLDYLRFYLEPRIRILDVSHATNLHPN